MSEDKKSDSQPLNTLAQGVVDGTGAFLGKICLPAAEEFGLLLRDKVKAWRNNNFIKIAEKTEEIIERTNHDEKPSVHPRILIKTYEEGSWTDDDLLQKMWSGLLASSCFDDKSDRNIVYLDSLSKMSSSEARLFNYICKSSELRVSWTEDSVQSLTLFSEPNSLKEAIEANSFDEVDQSLTHLEFLGVLKQERHSKREIVSYDTMEDRQKSGSMDDLGWMSVLEITVTSFGVRLFFKSRGLNGNPSIYVRSLEPNEDDEYEDWYTWDEWDELDWNGRLQI